MSTSTPSPDTIRLTGLSARGFHGVFPSERQEGQLFVVDVTLGLGRRGTAVSAVTDTLDDAVDYSQVASAVVRVIEGEPVNLIETLAERIAEVTLAFGRVQEVEVSVHKPQAPLDVAFDDVVVTIHRDTESVGRPGGQLPAGQVAAPQVASWDHQAGQPAGGYAGAAGAAPVGLSSGVDENAGYSWTGQAPPPEPSYGSAPQGWSAPEPQEPAPTTGRHVAVGPAPSGDEAASTGSASAVSADPSAGTSPEVSAWSAAFGQDPAPAGFGGNEVAAQFEESAPANGGTDEWQSASPESAAWSQSGAWSQSSQSSDSSAPGPAEQGGRDEAGSVPGGEPDGQAVPLDAAGRPFGASGPVGASASSAPQAGSAPQAASAPQAGSAPEPAGQPWHQQSGAPEPAPEAPAEPWVLRAADLEAEQAAASVQADQPAVDFGAGLHSGGQGAPVPDSGADEGPLPSVGPADVTPAAPAPFGAPVPGPGFDAPAPGMQAAPGHPVAGQAPDGPGTSLPFGAQPGLGGAPVPNSDGGDIGDIGPQAPAAGAEPAGYEQTVAVPASGPVPVGVPGGAQAPSAPAIDPLTQRPAGPVEVVLGLGGNVGAVVQTLRDAVAGLKSAEGVIVTGVAPLARTAAVVDQGAPDQPDYLNTVVLLSTSLSPYEVLEVCQGLEQAAGRVRSEPHGPRTLDVDIVSYEGVTSSDLLLTLPHPRAAQRAFVLSPWAQAEPFAELAGQSVAALAEAAPDREGLRWLALDWLESDHLPALPTGQYVAPPEAPGQAPADGPEAAAEAPPATSASPMIHQPAPEGADSRAPHEGDPEWSAPLNWNEVVGQQDGKA